MFTSCFTLACLAFLVLGYYFSAEPAYQGCKNKDETDDDKQANKCIADMK